MSNKLIYEKINQAVRLLCDVYDILNEYEEKKPESDLFTIKQFLERNKSFTMGQIRTYISDNKNNFKNKVMIKVGKKIFIKENEFFKWINGEI